LKKNDILITGGGGHARVVLGSLMRLGCWNIIGYTDIKDMGWTAIEYLGTDERLNRLVKTVRNAVVGVGQLKHFRERFKLYQSLKDAGFSLPYIVSKSAVLMQETSIGEGCYVGENAYIGPLVKLGVMDIVNTGAIVEHDSRIGDFVHVSINSSIAGNATIGKGTLIGMGACVLNGISVGENVLVSAGAVVRRDVPDGSLAYGNPAQVKQKSYAE
jgi:sugar O-acyltransferase (sialic acid O-acetyltransferase NeuD family)